jgi:hypothetical protein
MTDRERLIELLNGVLSTEDDTPTETVADYLLANGVIVPPCKVGDWIWYIRNDKVNKAKIEESVYSASKHGYFSDDWRFHAYNFSKKEEITFWKDNIGKTVFLTKSQAEEALKNEQEKLR